MKSSYTTIAVIEATLWLASAAFCLLVAQGAVAQSGPRGEPVNDCDRLAGLPLDPQGIGPGVEWAAFDPNAAIMACAEALETNPAEPRFRYQFGRALLKAERYGEALPELEAAYAAGHGAAATDLAAIYRFGWGVEENPMEAARWYKAAAESGHNGAQNNLGLLYQKGRGVEQDYAEAARLFKLSGAQGNRLALHNLGWLHQIGRGVVQSDQQAGDLYRQSIALGYRGAFDKLDRLYIESSALQEQSAGAGLDLLRRAAARGVAAAHVRLAYLHERGVVMPADWPSALRHYAIGARLATESGDWPTVTLARARQAVLARILDAEQAMQAMSEARNWMPTAGPPNSVSRKRAPDPGD